MSVINKILFNYGLKPLDLTKEQDILKMTKEYQYALSTLFYPKTKLTKEDIDYVETFWNNRTKELDAYLNLVNNLKNQIADNNGNTLSYDVKVSIAHFRSIPNLTGVAELKHEEGSSDIKHKEIIIPEKYIINSMIITLSINFKNTIASFYSNSIIKFALDYRPEDYSDTVSTLLLVDSYMLDSNYLLPRGYSIGRYCTLDNLIVLYLNGKVYMCYNINGKWYEILTDMTDIYKYSNIFFRRLINSGDTNLRISTVISDSFSTTRNAYDEQEQDNSEEIEKYCSEAIPFHTFTNKLLNDDF